ncbi:coniferyl aldehyde dehydrogenase [Solimonas fluminis]|uniref:Aldehyde dehydrogenase n=1 Tax=Solimonas fluminis TaxID=2086571 RepID=A0A2S5TAY1_9GAMM|nr:coniferyl aldehyde dehydrogenase [Solimonas fluminis]PPE72112.1 coniferyl aldehyde dehydrogenase [Solimonas fluminis]
MHGDNGTKGVGTGLSGLLQAQQAAYAAEPYPSAEQRIDRLRRLLAVLESHESRIVEALSADFGYRSPHQTWFAEVVTTAKPLRLAISRLRHWMRPERRSPGLPFKLLGARAEVHYQPLGVVGVISPWNVPVNLAIAPLAGILAAGNRVMMKPSEATPATAALLQEMIASAFGPAELAVVTGGVEVGREFSALPFDHLLYTGGEVVAKHIMRAASEHLTPLTLELGGKSPTLIGEGADLALAARRIAFGKVFNAGQVCLAPDYVLVPNARKRELVDALIEAFKGMLPESSGSRDFVAAINERHAGRLRGYVQEARASGAEVIELEWTGRSELPGASMVPLTMVVEPAPSLALMREEIFGPLLPIVGYDCFEDALASINARPRPLALYYFGDDRRQVRELLTRTVSGGVTLNDVIMHYTMDDLPFGGVGASGMGAYHGRDGFRRFSHARAVYRQSRFDVGAMLRPPYGPRFERIARVLQKHG